MKTFGITIKCDNANDLSAALTRLAEWTEQNQISVDELTVDEYMIAGRGIELFRPE